MQLAMEAALDLDDGREHVVKGRVGKWAASLVDVRLELVAEAVEAAGDDERVGVAERAEALAVDAVADVEQEVEVAGCRGRPRSSRGSARASGCRRGRACTCRTTRARRSAKRAAHTRPCSSGRRERSRPPSRSRCRPPRGCDVESRVDLVGREQRRGEPARADRFQRSTIRDPSAELVDQVAQGVRLGLVVAPAHDVAGEGEDPRSRRVRHAELGVAALPSSRIGTAVARDSTLLTTVGDA